MPGGDSARAGLADRLHLTVAVLAVWLAATSPWLAMLRRIPVNAGWLDWSHVLVGCLLLFVSVVYAWAVAHGGRWRLIFPVLPGQRHAIRSDFIELTRGRIPASESGGLFGLIEGLLLAALLLAGITGVAWFVAQGTDWALGWRTLHQFSARGAIGLLVAHVTAVGLHLLEFVRD